MNILITAGPTVEPIDDVRYISNYSSGKMGLALANASKEAGHNVRVILGPVKVPAPQGMKVFPIETADELFNAIEKQFEWADCLIMAAAVCDYRPRDRFAGKIKGKNQPLTLELVANKDILAHFGRMKEDKLILGFALESDNGIANARKKCVEKNCDIVALNAPSALNSDETCITLVCATGRILPLPATEKIQAAQLLVKELEELYKNSRES